MLSGLFMLLMHVLTYHLYCQWPSGKECKMHQEIMVIWEIVSEVVTDG